MANLVLSSPLTPAGFSTISLGPDANELPQRKIGLLGSGKPVVYIFENYGIRSRLPELQAIEARRLEMGQPKQNMVAVKVAICDSGGQPVVVTDEEGSSLTDKGVITLSDESYDHRGLLQGVTMTFWPCTYLRYYGVAAAISF